MSRVTFGDLRSAAYCPRQCYYDRTTGDRKPPPSVERVRELAFQYERWLGDGDPAGDGSETTGRSVDGPDPGLASTPVAVSPARYRRRLARARDRLDRWDELCEPPARDVLVTGRECRGIVHKALTDPPAPSLVSAGEPPDRGVWEPQSVHAVAAAKALAWERETPVERAYVEYPAHGVIRRVELTTRRKAAYRRTLRTVRELDGPPPRTRDRAKCEACEYAPRCGVRTRTLRSLLRR